MFISFFLNKVEASIIEVLNNNLRNRFVEGAFSDWDAEMRKNKKNLINPLRIYFKTNKKAREECKWKPPPLG